MRILLDEDLPRRLGVRLIGHEVSTVQQSGWSGIKNGKLLALAAARFDAFLTMDGNLEYRRRGVGAAILRHALAHAASTFGVRQVNLGVNANNTAALALYRSLGFEQHGLERDFLFVGGQYHDECQMVWRAAAGE